MLLSSRMLPHHLLPPLSPHLRAPRGLALCRSSTRDSRPPRVVQARLPTGRLWPLVREFPKSPVGGELLRLPVGLLLLWRLVRHQARRPLSLRILAAEPPRLERSGWLRSLVGPPLRQCLVPPRAVVA